MMGHFPTAWRMNNGLAPGVGLAAAAFLLAGLPAAAAAPNPQVRGQGSGVYLHPPFTGDRVDIALDAQGASGRFEVTHVDKFGKVFDHLLGVVTCVSVSGATAFTSGTITAAEAPELAGDLVGKSLAITIVDDGNGDLVGLSFPLDQMSPCSPWPLNMVIDRGSYTISR
jgi:hypothetical protein